MSGHVCRKDEGDNSLETGSQLAADIYIAFSPILVKCFFCTVHLSDLFERLQFHVGEDVALGKGKDLEGHGAVVVLQGRYVVVAHRQLGASVDLIPGRWIEFMSSYPRDNKKGPNHHLSPPPPNTHTQSFKSACFHTWAQCTELTLTVH